MNQHGLGWAHFRKIRRHTRLLMGIIIAVVSLVTVLIFVSGFVFGETLPEPIAPVELNERLNLAVVMRGACCVIVGGGVVVTPTPQGVN